MINLTKFVAGICLVIAAQKGSAQSVFQYRDNAGLGSTIRVQVPSGADAITGAFSGTGTITSVSFPVTAWSNGGAGHPNVPAYTYTLADMTGGSLNATYFPGTSFPFVQSEGLVVNLSFTDQRDGAGFNLSVINDGLGAETPFYATAPFAYGPNQYGPLNVEYLFQSVMTPVPEPGVNALLMLGCAAIAGFKLARKSSK